MEQLNYQTLKQQGYSGYYLEQAPERVLQFGEGNFLRAFVEDFIDQMNEKAGFNGKVVLCQPIANGLADLINQQQGLYNLYLRGMEQGQLVERQRLISCVSRCINPYQDFQSLLDCAANPELRFIVSNTTEAGIVYDPACKLEDKPASSFPGKLTQFLYQRFLNKLPGFIILSCELIDNNGKELLACVKQYIDQWQLPAEFAQWVEEENQFCSTLVDRIVTGYPRQQAEQLCQQLGYQDNLLDTGEVFGFWVIEGPQSILQEFPVQQANLPILVVDDHTPYKKRKVRILNGAHTSMVLAAYLAGMDIVRDCMQDSVVRRYIERTIQQEVIPTLPLPKQELADFAAAVTDRFANPYIDHSLLAISLNSTSKWRARVLPSLLDYNQKFGYLPRCIVFSFAAYLAFYHHGHTLENGVLLANRGEQVYSIQDDAWVLEFFLAHHGDSKEQLVQAVCENQRMWGQDLSRIPGFADMVVQDLCQIEQRGMYGAMQNLLEEDEQ